MREVRFPESIEQLKPGDHLCCIYETEEQHRDLLTPFLNQGLIQQEKVFYIINHHSSGDILDYLRSAGLKVEPYLEAGQLRILAPEDTYLRNRVFDPHEIIALLETNTKQALAEGWAGLRVTGEMTWALQGMPGSDRLIEYGAELNKFLPGSHCIALCQYDRHSFEPQVLLNVLRTHPTAVIGTEIYRNFYYVSPEALLGTRPVEAELQRWIENLVEHKRAVEALRESEEYQRAMIAASPLAIFSLDPDGRVLTWNKAAEGIFGWSEEEVVGRFLPIVPEDQLGIFTKLRERVIGGEEFSQIELTRRRK
ncbi:MAG: MEDS domain-containing protein, partial [Desulfobacteraceae bacterium]